MHAPNNIQNMLMYRTHTIYTCNIIKFLLSPYLFSAVKRSYNIINNIIIICIIKIHRPCEPVFDICDKNNVWYYSSERQRVI